MHRLRRGRAGENCTLSWVQRGRPNVQFNSDAGNNNLIVTVDGAPAFVDSAIPDYGRWEARSAAFLAAGPVARVAFVSTNPRGGDHALLIDDIRLACLPSRGAPTIVQAAVAACAAVAAGGVPSAPGSGPCGEPDMGSEHPTSQFFSLLLAESARHLLPPAPLCADFQRRHLVQGRVSRLTPCIGPVSGFSAQPPTQTTAFPATRCACTVVQQASCYYVWPGRLLAQALFIQH